MFPILTARSIVLCFAVTSIVWFATSVEAQITTKPSSPSDATEDASKQKPAVTPKLRKPNLKEFAWIAGQWHGEALGGKFEETWNAPMGKSMMGMFKLSKDEGVSFYEILTIVEENDTVLLRLKHFDNKLVGWEEKDKSIEFPFVSVSKTEAIFDGLKFVKIDENTMHILVKIKRGAAVSELKFVCNRVKCQARLH